MKNSLLKKILCLAVLLLTLAVITGCQNEAEESQDELFEVVFGVPHKEIGVGTEAICYAVPKQLGYFEEEGLDVELITLEGSPVIMQLIGSGRVHTGQGAPVTVLNAIIEGVPATCVYNLIPKYGSGLAVLDDSPIKSIGDLEKGMLIGVSALASGRVPEAETMLEHWGFGPDDVSIVAVGTGSQAAGALTTGQVDGLYMWDQAYATLEGQGIKLRVLRDVFPGSEKLMDYVQFFSTDMVNNHPDKVEGYGRAMAKGLLWSITNPAGALDLFYKEFPAYKPVQAEVYEGDLFALTSYANQHKIEGSDAIGYGHFPEGFVEFTTDFLYENGKLDKVDDYNILYTNKFLESYNDFDEEAVIKSAQEYEIKYKF